MKAELKIRGMHCGSCEKRIIEAVGNLRGVSSISISLKEGNAFVNFNDSKISLGEIIHEIEKMGYNASDKNKEGIFSRIFKRI